MKEVWLAPSALSTETGCSPPPTTTSCSVWQSLRDLREMNPWVLERLALCLCTALQRRFCVPLSIQQEVRVTLDLGEGWGVAVDPEQDVAEECNTGFRDKGLRQ